MRFRAFTFLFLFLIPISIYCQIDFRIDYHPYVNKAELAITEGNYVLALDNYKRAFKLVDYGFGRDYHNAALCAIEMNEFDLAIEYLNQLIAKGLEKDYFERNKEDYTKLVNHGFDKFIDEFDTVKQNTFDRTVNYYLLGSLGELENRDQEFRHDYKLYRDTILKTDLENISRLLSLIEEYGFPTEEMLGLQSPHADNPYYDLIIWHHLQNWKHNNSLIDIRPILIEAIKTGKLSPEQAAAYFNIAESRHGGVGSFGDTGVIKFSGDAKFYTLENGNEKLINQNRKRLGLYNIDDFEQKIRYHAIQEEGISKFKVLKLGGVEQYPIEAKGILQVKELKSISNKEKKATIVN